MSAPKKSAAKPAKRENQIAERATDVGALALKVDNVPAQVLTALKTSLYPGATDDSIALVIAYCQAGGLDPLTKPVHIVPMALKTGEKKPDGKDIYANRDVIMPGIELYRTKAHRSGLYAGMDAPEYGDDIEHEFRGDEKARTTQHPDGDGMTFRFPEWCEITVYRIDGRGGRHPYTSGRIYWLETYASVSRYSDNPNAMWKKRPRGQLEKCAEAMALRRAFPEFVGAQPTAEEMIGRHVDNDAIDGEATPVIREPRPKQLSNNSGSGSNAAGSHTGASRSATGSGSGGGSAGSGNAKPAKAGAGEPGIHLEPGPLKILNRWITSARTTSEKLLERFPRIDIDNFNPIVAELRELASAEGNDGDAADPKPAGGEEE